ncbi:ChbG/HpnK family deacetylase [Thauera sinica]|uniref:ChbG/HpnK family deacetylase n=1 Tax=Thauera sinica TaxID=2665146 RepID=A0ABW1AU82_9RHOO|nr:ChbG/HpnK family deacetylase [Thauera sp. K11]ATE62376.1 cellobiose phosphorylase [Thauera sp. K11]
MAAPSRLRPIVICADDYGLAPGVSDAIAGLIAAGRLSATSCMTALPDWRRAAAPLREIIVGAPADVGLHLTLTDQAPLGRARGLAVAGRLPPLGRLLPRALARGLPAEGVADELRAQLDAFEDAWGAPPDYVDGHQHVHVLPGVREALVAELLRRYPVGRVWVRDCVEAPSRCLRRGESVAKSLFIGALGRGLRKRLRATGIPANDGFSGLHDFSAARPFGDKMRRFLRALGPRPLLHVHPGRVDAALLACDALTTPREAELAYLASDEFAGDLAAAGVRPARFAGLAGTGHA